MKGKKKDEHVDTSNLPKINIFTSSLIFGTENPERRIKLLETIYKSNHKFLKLIPREQLIEFAKEKGIFSEPDDKKKKDDPTIEKREINADELAKAAVAIIQDRALPMMREKKTLMEKIEELKKLKEEAIQQRDNPQPVDPKKKVDPKKPAVPVNPDEIIIPTIEEFGIDLGLVFYNYPQDENEAHHLEKENQVLNQIIIVRDIDEYIHPEEVKEDPNNLDPKAKKAAAPAKDPKAGKDNDALLKYFPPPPRSSYDIYYELKIAKYQAHQNSLLKLICFELMEFSTNFPVNISINNTASNVNQMQNSNANAGNVSMTANSVSPNNNEEENKDKEKEKEKKDPYQNIIDLIADKQTFLNKYYIYYTKWFAETNSVKLNEFSDDPAMQRKINDTLVQKLLIESDIKKKDFEHLSMGAILIAFYIDLVKHMREINHIGEHNMIIYEKNDVDNLFDKLENEIMYEYSADTKSTNKDYDNYKSNLSSHMIVEQEKEIENQELEINKIDDLSSYFKLIIDEKDFILKNALDNEIERFRLGEREKAFNLFRKFPGIGRNLMPDVSPKEENFRKAKKCEIYPFLDNSIGIPIYEKYDVIKKFEDIFKEKINEYDFDFGDRIYQEIMNRDLLSQTLNNAMIYDTETLYYYNERDDNLLFSTYYRCPKGRIYRKTNKYRYLSKPNLDNWITCFKPTFNERVKKETEKTEENLNNNNEPGNTEMNNNASRIVSEANNNLNQNTNQNVENTNANVNPNESNNVTNANVNNNNTFTMPQIKVDKKPEIEFGNNFNPESDLLYDTNDIYLGEITEKIKYMFPSDNGVFVKKIIENGIFKTFNSYVKKDNLVFGIKNNKEKIQEFWMKFDNDVTMTVNYIGNYNSLEENYDSKNGTYTNFAFKNGLNIQILPNGEICQKIDKINDEPLKDVETHRIITSKASIISHYKMTKANIMYANGNVCTIAGGTSINTNNKGFRVAKRLADNFEYEMEPLAVTIQSDPETNNDKVMNIKYPDNSMLTVHQDNTKIFTFSDQLKYLVEHENFASCEIRYDPVKKRTKTVISEGSSDALLGNDDLMTRSYDGRLSKIQFPDKTLVYTYKEKKATDQFDLFTFNTINLIYRPDGTVIRIQQDGDIVIVSAKERQKFNADGHNLQDGSDTDYLFEINGKPEDRRGGVYSVDMKKEKIYTKDTEKNIFELHADGTAKYKLSVTLDLDNSHKTIEEIRPDSPRYHEKSYIDPEANFLEAPKDFIHPRLFVIENDNSGYELLNEDQITNFKLNKQKDVLHSKYMQQEMETYFHSHYWITKYLNVSQLISETHYINNIKIPRKLEKITQTPVNLQFPPNEIYLYRNLIQSIPFDENFREKINLTITNRDNWFSKRKLDFGYVDISNIPELKDNYLIQKRILEERQKSDLKFDSDNLKNEFIMSLQNAVIKAELSLRENESLLFDITKFLDEKDKKKIIEDKSFRIMPLNIKNIEINEFLNTLNKDELRKSNKSLSSGGNLKVQEIIFSDNFFHTDAGRIIMEQYPRSVVKKKKNNKSEDDGLLSANEENDKFSNDNTKKSNDNKDPNMNVLDFMQDLNPQRFGDNFENDENLNQNLISPIVYLDEDKKFASKGIFNKSKSSSKMKKTLPSIHKRTMEIIKQKANNENKQSERWHEIKNYKFAVDGKSPRKENPKVPKYLQTTFPEAEFNENYIYVEKMTDKRLKTSSVANRLYFNAPSINMIRKSGQHNFLLEALEKKKTYEEMMERLNLMITSELCDPLNKMLKVEPTSLDFGYLRMGNKYEMSLKIRNDDNITNRVQLRKTFDNKTLGIELFFGGKLTPGQTKRIKITLNATEDISGNYTDEVQIQTKAFVYKIPITAFVANNEEYEKLEEDNIQRIGKRLKTNAKIYIKEIPKEFLKEINTNILNNLPDDGKFSLRLDHDSNDASNYDIDNSMKLPKINS